MLTRARELTVLGLNSGTSADGLDLALVTVPRAGARRPQFIAGTEQRYSPTLREAILGISSGESVPPDDIVRLNTALGRWVGRTAQRWLHAQEQRPDLIVSHGQTIRHTPVAASVGGLRSRGTWQIGSLSEVATATNCVTLGNLREAAIAVGTEGAPITAAAMHRLFADRASCRLILNLGGIANYFLLPPLDSPEQLRAGDIGPGNLLSDQLCRELANLPFDRGGRLARGGTIDTRLRARMAEWPQWRVTTTSTGREQFGAEFVARIRRTMRQHSVADILATVNAVTVDAITARIRRLTREFDLKQLYLTGGGRRNSFWVMLLHESLPSLSVTDIDVLGLPGDLVEAAAYAVLGASTAFGQSQEIIGTNHRVHGKARLGQMAWPAEGP